MAVGLTTNLRHNTWNLGQLYDQNVSGDSNVIDYSGARTMWAWGYGNDNYYMYPGSGWASYSSPVQTPGTNWKLLARCYSYSNYNYLAKKTDGTLWAWGTNGAASLGQGRNNPSGWKPDSAEQIPSAYNDSWSDALVVGGIYRMMAVRSSGGLYAWGGNNTHGELGQNNLTAYSSPTQVGSSNDWATNRRSLSMGENKVLATKTDGTLWAWGKGDDGVLAQNNDTTYSSPVQIPGTTWSKVCIGNDSSAAVKTDGTLWVWGRNNEGELGLNESSTSRKSSPVQIPGTTWRTVDVSLKYMMATKTDGTLWAWGHNEHGVLGLNQAHDASISSPVQIPGTTWSEEVSCTAETAAAIKTDGSIWTWGRNLYGQLGQNSRTLYSSPVQMGSLTNWKYVSIYGYYSGLAMIWATTNT